MQDTSSVNCSKMPTAKSEELILAGIIAFHFKKLKCRYHRSPRGGIVFEKSFLSGHPGNTPSRLRQLRRAFPPKRKRKEDLSSSGRRKECVWSESISLLLEEGLQESWMTAAPEFQEKIGGMN
ncbi:hypothetical protein CEXT_448181 [Caerostris extrusa]|uniref:Uncharacterized protein n=1 Tax=Caerostris extrusa TaxID=172846 RepID=A0AAV4XRA5_CAEEX|nr:hypothetical protein CEXT_448181 [Caerostris extrusa]